jgi:TolB-like protein/DNA-binding winged helix-turn-helix (wHTH) protein/Tfp pilus assembly protein PilF
MQPAVPARRLVQFGVFELDLDTAELRKQGVKVKLQDQPCKVLQILLEKPGQIVTRDELRTRVWPANTFVEFDQGLYSAMARLREALGDSSDNPRFIETLARRGYRFIAPVNPPATENPPLPHPDLRFEPSTSQPNPSIRRFLISILAGLLGGALVLALILGFNIGGARQWLLRHSNRPIRSIAVLPLENLSGDPAQDYFADGMTDELITNLAELGSLRVISRTSSMQYKGVRKALRQIGNELGVDAVLEGSVSRSGQHVRITAQLIDAASDQHLWARTYDRDLGDVLIMQNEMADAIAGEVRAKLATAQPRPGKLSRVDPEEQDLYLRARYHLDKGSETEIKKGIEYFRQAIGRNPQDARNFAGLAVSYLALADYYLSPADTLFQAKQAAVKALQLDENLAETHVSLGAIDFLYDWDWQQADREFAQAVKLNPNSSDAHLWRGEFLAQMGRPDEGIAEMKLAESIDPLSLAVHVNAGWVYYVAKQEEQALEEWRKILDIDPHFTITHTAIWITYIKRAEMGSTLSERSAQTEEDTLNMAAVIGRYAVSGNRAEAERLLSRLDSISKHQYVCPYEMATAHAVLGDKDKAFVWLRKGLQERSSCMSDVKVDPRLDSLRSDPRFDEVLKAVGFQPD